MSLLIEVVVVTTWRLVRRMDLLSQMNAEQVTWVLGLNLRL